MQPLEHGPAIRFSEHESTRTGSVFQLWRSSLSGAQAIVPSRHAHTLLVNKDLLLATLAFRTRCGCALDVQEFLRHGDGAALRGKWMFLAARRLLLRGRFQRFYPGYRGTRVATVRVLEYIMGEWWIKSLSVTRIFGFRRHSK